VGKSFRGKQKDKQADVTDHYARTWTRNADPPPSKSRSGNAKEKKNLEKREKRKRREESGHRALEGRDGGRSKAKKGIISKEGVRNSLKARILMRQGKTHTTCGLNQNTWITHKGGGTAERAGRGTLLLRLGGAKMLVRGRTWTHKKSKKKSRKAAGRKGGEEKGRNDLLTG